MTLRRWLFSVAALVACAGVAWVSQEAAPAGLRMTQAADKLLASLSDEQKAKAVFGFDSPERFNWHFVPLQDKERKPTRRGLGLGQMNDEQRQLVLALLAAGTSKGGYETATTIMSLESILNELEKGGNIVRSPDWYFVSVYGKPSRSGEWGWRIEGHHLSLNYTLREGKVVAATPAFFGANPAVVMQGPRKGLKTLGDEADLPKAILRSLSEEQKKAAYLPKAFPEVSAQNQKVTVGEPVGLAAAGMNPDQQALVRRLLTAYTARMPAEVAAEEMKRISDAGFGKIRFAYTGGTEPGQPHTYRIHGPTFVIEYLNVQADSAKNPANHIHSCWRSLPADFGLALK